MEIQTTACVAVAQVVNGRGAGKYRDKWTIRRFLDSRGTSMTAEAVKLGLYPQAFQETVAGIRNDRRVLRHLMAMGCPIEALSLPKDLQ